MYNGMVNIDNLYANEILEFLEACDELNFNELIDDLQYHLIINGREWINANLVYLKETPII